MSRPLELVIFDCDGVLVDSERIAVRVDTELLAELGWPLSEAEVVERFMGRTTDDMLRAIEAEIADLEPGWEVEFDRRYMAALEAELEPVDGVVEALDAIAAPTCVASSGTHEKMRFTLGRTGLYERFAGRIFSADDVARGKPAPDLFLHAARTLGADPAACAVVEDSRHGVEAARAAGMRVLAYGGGGLIPRAQLAGPGTVVFDDMRELPRLLEG
ncbi:MAG TPA: HAD family hydrolase [Solirubrobacteraceae bacterium]